MSDAASPPGNQGSLMRDLTRVELLNHRFYSCFAQLDIEGMAEIWARSPHVRCVHAGWELVVGYEDVRQSWAEVFMSISEVEFELEDVQIQVLGDTAWANFIVYINLSDSHGEGFQATVVVTHIFERQDQDWKLVLHHSSNFIEEAEPDDADDYLIEETPEDPQPFEKN